MSKQDMTARTTMAEQADLHDLYEKSVQSPESDIEFFIDTYKALRGTEPMSLREDFCGTSFLSVEWCKTNPERTAIGIDLDEPTLEWGRAHNIEPAGQDIARRVSLYHANVLDITEPKVDVTCALNFSFCIFKTRDEIRDYFKVALAGLKSDGLFVMDLFGGTEAIDELEEDRDVDDEPYTYVWEHASFNPINHNIICHIHFDFPDGSRLEKAFTYDWRLWTIPELKELLLEAGFSKVRVYWEEFEDTDDDDDELEGTGEYSEVEEVENQESWISYIVAEP